MRATHFRVLAARRRDARRIRTIHADVETSLLKFLFYINLTNLHQRPQIRAHPRNLFGVHIAFAKVNRLSRQMWRSHLSANPRSIPVCPPQPHLVRHRPCSRVHLQRLVEPQIICPRNVRREPHRPRPRAASIARQFSVHMQTHALRKVHQHPLRAHAAKIIIILNAAEPLFISNQILVHKNLARPPHRRWHHQSPITIETRQHLRLSRFFRDRFTRPQRHPANRTRSRLRSRRRCHRRANKVRRPAPLQRRGHSRRRQRVNARRHFRQRSSARSPWPRHANFLIGTRDAAGINSCSRSVRLHSRDDIQSLPTRRSLSAPMMPAHATHRRRRIPRRTLLRSTHPVRRRSLNPSRPPSAVSRNSMRTRSPAMHIHSTRVPRMRSRLRPMRNEMCRSVPRRHPPAVRRIRLRQHFTHRAKHRERHHDAPHRDPHRCARSRLRACAGFRLSVAPLLHHHHKFLRWPRSRRASSAYPHTSAHGSADSDARTLTITMLATWSVQFFLLGRSVAVTVN
jgi:hypothetical protein